MRVCTSAPMPCGPTQTNMYIKTTGTMVWTRWSDYNRIDRPVDFLSWVQHLYAVLSCRVFTKGFKRLMPWYTVVAVSLRCCRVDLARPFRFSLPLPLFTDSELYVPQQRRASKCVRRGWNPQRSRGGREEHRFDGGRATFCRLFCSYEVHCMFSVRDLITLTNRRRVDWHLGSF